MCSQLFVTTPLIMCSQLFTPLLLALSLTFVTCQEPAETTESVGCNEVSEMINSLNEVVQSIRKGHDELQKHEDDLESVLKDLEEATGNAWTVPQKEETNYTLITDSKKNWYEAFADCRKRGLDLASILNEKEYQRVYSQLKDADTHSSFWLSGVDLAQTGTYVWMSTGDNVRYHKWHRTNGFNQPDHDVDSTTGEVEHCTELRHDFNYDMNDNMCGQPFNYICDDRNFKNPEMCDQKDKEFTVFTGVKLSWFEAIADCKAQGLRLATIENEQEHQEVVNLIKSQDLPNDDVFWLSGSDLGHKGDYEWMTSGQPLDYEAWYSGQPNHDIKDGEMERCLSLKSGYDYMWFDSICFSRNYYICDNQ